MTWLLPILTKIAWWLYPKLIACAIDAISFALAEVESAEAFNSLPAAKRTRVHENLVARYGMIPEPVTRFLVEFALLLFRLGVTGKHLQEMEVLVTGMELTALESPDKRRAVLGGFAKIFPELPERIGRLLLEIVVAKLKGGGSLGVNIRMTAIYPPCNDMSSSNYGSQPFCSTEGVAKPTPVEPATKPGM
jgi:hypothetical protein